MSRPMVIFVLALAAILEASGDAIIRSALHNSSSAARVPLFLLGAVVLFAYGWTVNAPSWDFGRLIGVYVVFFFLTAQLISWLYFRQPPSISGIVAGALIVAGGIVFAAGNP